MKLCISEETEPCVKHTLYVDMDGVLVDFNAGINRLSDKTRTNR